MIAFALLALAACHARDDRESPANEAAAAPTAAEGAKGIHRENKGKPAPGTVFKDPDQKPVKLADFAGKPVLVNLWASWCAPCIKELPKLDQLARSDDLQVLAISQDSGPSASVKAFLQAHGIATLKAYQDPSMGISGALGAEVLPTSILFDSKGREVWRYVGDFDWTSSEAARLLAEAGVPPKKA